MREAMSRLQRNPLLHPIRHRRKQVRWSYPRRFPYRIVFRVLRETVVIYAVLRAARHDSHWQQRIDR
jgi:toxin ParE1/3/4